MRETRAQRFLSVRVLIIDSKSTSWQERATQTYETVEPLKTEQAATAVTLLQLESGEVVAPPRQVFGQKEKRHRSLPLNVQEKFSNECSLDEYISALRTGKDLESCKLVCIAS